MFTCCVGGVHKWVWSLTKLVWAAPLDLSLQHRVSLWMQPIWQRATRCVRRQGHERAKDIEEEARTPHAEQLLPYYWRWLQQITKALSYDLSLRNFDIPGEHSPCRSQECMLYVRSVAWVTAAWHCFLVSTLYNSHILYIASSGGN